MTNAQGRGPAIPKPPAIEPSRAAALAVDPRTGSTSVQSGGPRLGKFAAADVPSQALTCQGFSPDVGTLDRPRGSNSTTSLERQVI